MLNFGQDGNFCGLCFFPEKTKHEQRNFMGILRQFTQNQKYGIEGSFWRDHPSIKPPIAIEIFHPRSRAFVGVVFNWPNSHISRTKPHPKKKIELRPGHKLARSIQIPHRHVHPDERCSRSREFAFVKGKADPLTTRHFAGATLA